MRAPKSPLRAACAALAAFAGCGFEGQGIVEDGRDHDGDGIDDAADPCPHIRSAANADADGDGIGDECDPSNAVQHRRVIFDGFSTVPSESAWEVAGYGTLSTWRVVTKGEASYLHQIESTEGRRQLRLRGPVRAATVTTAVRVEAVPNGAFAHRAGVFVADRSKLATGAYGVCSLQRANAAPPDSAVATMSMGDTDVAASSATAPWSALVGEAQITAGHGRNGEDAVVRCDVRRGADARTMTTQPSVADTLGQLGLHTAGLSVMFDYIFVVAPR